MKRVSFRLAALVGALAASAMATAQQADLIGEARSVADSVPPKLFQVLMAEIKKGGPEGAISVCRDQAPKMAANASQQTGWQIGRVSLRPRSPKAEPDAWERSVLEDFDRRVAAGESTESLERGEVVSENGTRSYRYMKALPTRQLCLDCHGPTDTLSPAVRSRLKEHYPTDTAIGYALGQIRGAMTIRKPL